MKKIRSLVAAFTLATAGMMTMGASQAQAQTVPVYGGGQQVYDQQPNTGAAVSQGAIDDLAYNVGVQTVYYRDGRGFTQGTAQDGENIGLEFQLSGGNATVIRAYNLNDPNSRYQFQEEVNVAAANERTLADNEYRTSTRIYPVYEPSAYIICAPVRPIIGIGWIIGGWHPGYVPVFHRWNGFWDDHGHRNHGYDRGYNNHNTTIINNNTYIGHGDHGDRGWQHGGNQNQWHNQAPPQQHVNQNQNPWGGGHERHDNPVVRQPVQQQHVETRQAEPRHVETRQAEPQRHYEAPQRTAQPRGGWQQQGGGAQHDGPRGHHR